MARPGIAPRILCIGIPVRDLTFRVEAVPERGSKANATHLAEICGGNALNAAIAIARLGGRAAFAGPMGDAGETSSRFKANRIGRSSMSCLRPRNHLRNGSTSPSSPAFFPLNGP